VGEKRKEAIKTLFRGKGRLRTQKFQDFWIRPIISGWSLIDAGRKIAGGGEGREEETS